MRYIILSLFALVVGCTNTNNEIETMINDKENPRIIYRNLTTSNISQNNLISYVDRKPLPLCTPKEIVKKVIVEKCELETEQIKENKTIYHLLNNTPLLVGFYNEQVRPHNQNQLFDDFLRSANINSYYIIMGHSHGLSSYGVEKLAYMRANHVKKLLVKQGVASENIITLANWSKTKVIGTPALGVEIYY